MKKHTIKFITYMLAATFALSGLAGCKTFAKKEPIPADAVGNTSGNLNNHGLFCEYEGYVFFANPYDLSKLYRMNPDGTGAKKVADTPVEFINVYGDKVYYYQTPKSENQIFGLGGMYGICWSDANGKSGMNSYDKAMCNSMCLYGPNLFYQHYDETTGLSLWGINVETGEKKQYSDKRVFVSTPYNGKFLTYNEDNGYYISLYNPARDQFELFDQDTRVYNVVTEGSYVYYMDIDDSYRIHRMNLSSYEKEKLTDDKADLFNVVGNFIYYQKSDPTAPAIMRMGLDGSNPEIIAEGNYTNINCTTDYTYFYTFGDAPTLYRVPNRIGAYAERFIPE